MQSKRLIQSEEEEEDERRGSVGGKEGIVWTPATSYLDDANTVATDHEQLASSWVFLNRGIIKGDHMRRQQV